MTDDKLLRDLKAAFEYAYRHDEWVSPLEDELDGLTAADASWRPAPDAKCIWEIILHMTVWNENIIERIVSSEKSRPTEGAWPAMPDSADEAAWEAAKVRLRHTLQETEDFFSTTTMAKIEASPYGLPDLLVRYIHLGYHIGQITKLREERFRTLARSA